MNPSGMSALSELENYFVTRAYGFPSSCHTADIGGGERIIPEFEALPAEAGLKINRLIPTECYISVPEVVAA